jgi:hypothetical protein
MSEALNFHDAWFVVESNWPWLLLALALGIWTGWATAGGEKA